MEELHELKSRMEQERPARWEELPDRAKEWNRSAVRSIPSLLASVNLAVVK